MRRPYVDISSNIDPKTAMEMISVGIIPSTAHPSIGTRDVMAGQPIVVVGYATRDEFLQAVADAELSDQPAFQACPHDINFIRISTD